MGLYVPLYSQESRGRRHFKRAKPAAANKGNVGM